MAGDPLGFKPEFSNGISGKPFVIMTGRDAGFSWDSSLARVCYPEEIPVNTILFVKVSEGKYRALPINYTMAHPNNRRFLDVRYYPVMGLSSYYVADYAGESMVIIDNDYIQFPYPVK